MGVCCLIFGVNLGWGQTYCTPQYTVGPCYSESLPDRFKEIHLNGETINFDLSGYNCQNLRDMTNENIPDLIPGNTYTIVVETDNDSNDYLGTWIDYGDNGVFGDDDIGITEKIDNRHMTPNTETQIDYTIPLNAPIGIHRLRMRLAYSSSGNLNVNPCTYYVYGQAVDFLVEIIDPCTDPITITADKDFLCIESDEVTLTAEGGEPGDIFFFGEDPDDFDNLTESSQVTVNEPGTYYFRAYEQEEGCWETPVSIKIELLDIEIDAGEDKSIGCEGSAQIGFEPAPSVPDNYCVPEGTNSSRYINHFSTTGGIDNITNNNSGFSQNGYGDFTNMVLKGYSGTAIDFNADIVGGTAGFRIWIDWDQNGQFDITNEVVYESSGYSSNHQNSFDIPPSAAGTYRMRIVSHWLSTSGDAESCETGFTYGEFEDYTVQIGQTIDESATYSWEPTTGLDESDIPNPIASPSETTPYELTVTVDGCEFTDTVTVTVDNCLPVLEVCAKDIIIDLNQGLPENMNPENVVWYEDDGDGSPGSTQVSNLEDVEPGIYWASYDNECWRLKAKYDFTGDCLDCVEVEWEEVYNPQPNTSQTFNPAEADYGVLDFYGIVGDRFKIRYNGAVLNGGFFYFTPNNQANVHFLDGSIWGAGGIAEIGDLTGAPNKPILRFVFGPLGVEGFYGSKVSANHPDYELEPVELFNGAEFHSITWYESNMSIQIQKPSSKDLFYNFRSVNIAECPDIPAGIFINPQLRNRIEH